MSSRDISIALSKAKPEKYEEAITFLKEYIHLFSTMKIGAAGSWKPFQTAVLISTQTVIDISKLLLYNYQFDIFWFRD